MEVHTAAEAPNPRSGGEKEGGGKEIGGGGEVSRVVPNQKVGSNGCRAGTIDLSRGETSPKETPANCGRQGPKEGVPQGWHVEAAPEVLARDSRPL